MEVIAFFTFITLTSISGIVFNKLKQDNQQKSIREVIEKSHELDEEKITSLLKYIQLGGKSELTLQKKMKMAGPTCAFSGIGLCLFSYITKSLIGTPWIFLLGGGCIMIINGLGILLAARLIEKD